MSPRTRSVWEEDGMASEHENANTGSERAAGGARAVLLGRPLVAVAAFAAGAGVALGAKAVLDSRRKAGSRAPTAGDLAGNAADGPREDLPTVLRRAALDVALAATTEAAERFGAQAEAPESEA